jgi:hypothetical protein
MVGALSLPAGWAGRAKIAPDTLADSWKLPEGQRGRTFGLFGQCSNAGVTSEQPWWLTMPVAELVATNLPLLHLVRMRTNSG